MAKTAAEINADAQFIVDDLRQQIVREKTAMKQGRISFQAYTESKKTLRRAIKNTESNRAKQIKDLKLAALPDPSLEINERMQADHERRRFEKFMKDAGPVLEQAFELEVQDE